MLFWGILYCLNFSVLYYLAYKFKIGDTYRKILCVLFMLILGAFVLKRRNFIFIADFYIEI